MDVKPAAADQNRRLSGCNCEFSGSCGFSGPQRINGGTGTLGRQPPCNGPCTPEVWSVDRHGTGTSGTPATADFVIR
ncbi:hypothetical protein ACFYXS_18465 [Streptomyces sp. NPDC002574]|uniref:hypothetical protein n=1 Tax=Streptomyces sp. NPDC002574 TaxID=3364652 RepID=UPI003691172E